MDKTLVSRAKLTAIADVARLINEAPSAKYKLDDVATALKANAIVPYESIDLPLDGSEIAVPNAVGIYAFLVMHNSGSEETYPGVYGHVYLPTATVIGADVAAGLCEVKRYLDNVGSLQSINLMFSACSSDASYYGGLAVNASLGDSTTAAVNFRAVGVMINGQDVMSTLAQAGVRASVRLLRLLAFA